MNSFQFSIDHCDLGAYFNGHIFFNDGEWFRRFWKRKKKFDNVKKKKKKKETSQVS